MSLNLEIWIYLIDEQDGIIKSGDIDFGKSYIHLHEFKEHLKQFHTVDFFKNEKDLSDKIFKRLNKFIPKVTRKITRPEILECNVYRFPSPNYNWYIFLGYLKDVPFEIITGADLKDEEEFAGILIPKTVTVGKIKVTKDVEDRKIIRYDFLYVNKRGYKTTLEGLNYSFIPEISSFCRQASRLLQNNIDIGVIIDVIKDMYTIDEDHLIWKSNLIQILKNQ